MDPEKTRKHPLGSRFRDYIAAFFYSLLVIVRGQVHTFEVAFRYYYTLSFYRVDLLFLRYYFLHSAYFINYRYIRNHGKTKHYCYGPTPLTALEIMAQRCGLEADDHIYELGCGPGRTTFFLYHLLGARVVGIDIVPTFIQRANKIKDRLQYDKVSFVEGDIREINYESADVLYIYGTCWHEDLFGELIAILQEDLLPGAKVITVSKSLQFYDEAVGFTLVDQFTLPFLYGKESVFLHVYQGISTNLDKE